MVRGDTPQKTLPPSETPTAGRVIKNPVQSDITDLDKSGPLQSIFVWQYSIPVNIILYKVYCYSFELYPYRDTNINPSIVWQSMNYE